MWMPVALVLVLLAAALAGELEGPPLRQGPTLRAGVVALASDEASAQAFRSLQPLDAKGRVTYFIADGEPGSQFTPADKQLATWALRAWEQSIGGALRFELTPPNRGPADERRADRTRRGVIR